MKKIEHQTNVNSCTSSSAVIHSDPVHGLDRHTGLLYSKELAYSKIHVLDSCLFKFGCMLERIVWKRSVTWRWFHMSMQFWMVILWWFEWERDVFSLYKLPNLQLILSGIILLRPVGLYKPLYHLNFYSIPTVSDFNLSDIKLDLWRLSLSLTGGLDYPICNFLASEIQMMTIPQGQYVITETAVGTPVTTVNTGQVKAVTQVRRTIMAFFSSRILSGMKLFSLKI